MPHRADLAGQASQALSGIQVAIFRGNLQHEFAEWQRFGHTGSKAVLAMLPDVTVRVMFSRQKQKFDSSYIGGKGQGRAKRLLRRPASGAVTVKAEHNRIGEAEQLLHMLSGTSRAQRSHCVGKAHLRQRHHVHIPFRDQYVAVFAQGRARFKQAV